MDFLSSIVLSLSPEASLLIVDRRSFWAFKCCFRILAALFATEEALLSTEALLLLSVELSSIKYRMSSAVDQEDLGSVVVDFIVAASCFVWFCECKSSCREKRDTVNHGIRLIRPAHPHSQVVLSRIGCEALPAQVLVFTSVFTGRTAGQSMTLVYSPLTVMGG